MQMSATKCGRFERLCDRLEISDEAMSQAWSELWRRYSEPHRFYHTWEHVGSMLVALDGVATAVTTAGDVNDCLMTQIEMAIWFHDVIYDPNSSTNEADSAALFLQLLGSELQESDGLAIGRLIVATDPRLERGSSVDEQILVDIDLLVLSSDPEKYRAYAEAIRKEYAHVPEDAFREGRAAVLERILQKPIYVTEFFADREPAARANLREEIEALSLP